MRGARAFGVILLIVGAARCGGDEGSASDRVVDGGNGLDASGGGVSDGSWPDTSSDSAGGTSGEAGAGGVAGTSMDAASAGAGGGSARVSDGLVVRYDFDEGAGTTIQDVSGVGDPIDLTIPTPGAVTWLSGALRIDQSVVIGSAEPPAKLLSSCMANDEITIDAWVKPADLVQAGPARIVSFSTDISNRNFTLGQAAGDYVVRLRTSTGDVQGAPFTFATAAAATKLQHVAFKFDATGYVSIFVDAALAGALHKGGDFSTWASNYPLLLANELSGDRAWLGELHLVAIYCRGLSQAEIAQNFAAGPAGI